MDTKERLINLLPYYLQNGYNINKYYSVLAKFYNQIIDVFTDILDNRDIDIAELGGLDVIGDIIGQKRTEKYWQDEKYRNRLKTKVIQNNSMGYIEDINNLADAFLGENFIGVRQGYQFEDLKKEPAMLEVMLDGNNITNNATQYDMRYYKTGYKITGFENLNKVTKQVKKASSLPIFTELEKALAIGVRLQYRIKDTKEVIKISSGIKIIKQSTLECGATGLQAEIGVLL